jgi:hypothetical protein
MQRRAGEAAKLGRTVLVGVAGTAVLPDELQAVTTRAIQPTVAVAKTRRILVI